MPMTLVRPLGTGLPADSRFWRIFYDTFGVPSMRSQLFWMHLANVIRARKFRRVLDAGCGGGAFTVGLARELPGASITGLDADESSIGSARRLAGEAGVENVEWEVNSIQAFREIGFDLVVCLGVLESTADPGRVVKHLASLTEDRGVLAFTVPCAKAAERRQSHSGFHSSDEVLSWMSRAGCMRPRIVETLRGPVFRAYQTSQELQNSPILAACYHPVSLPLIYLDTVIPSKGHLLFCDGEILRDP